VRVSLGYGSYEGTGGVRERKKEMSKYIKQLKFKASGKSPIVLRGFHSNIPSISPRTTKRWQHVINQLDRWGNPYTGFVEAGLQSSNKEPMYGLGLPSP
jgi:hypothetical protein